MRLIGTKIKAVWIAPSNPVVDYRVFINDENVNSNGRIVASVLTSYIIKNTFSHGTTVAFNIRATSNHYWSPVETLYLPIYGILILNESPGVEIVFFLFTFSMWIFKKLYSAFLS